MWIYLCTWAMGTTNLLLNISASAAETKVSYVAPGGKPRLIHLSIKPIGVMVFSVGGMQRKATDFKIHAESGDTTGIIAPTPLRGA